MRIIYSSTLIAYILRLKKIYLKEDFVTLSEYMDINWLLSQYLETHNYDVMLIEGIDSKVYNYANGIISVDPYKSYEDILKEAEKNILLIDERVYDLFENSDVILNMLKEIRIKSLEKLINDGYINEDDITRIRKK